MWRAPFLSHYSFSSELRDQIRRARLEEDKAVNHLQRVKNRNEQLEAEMNLFKEQAGMYAVAEQPTRGQHSEVNQAGENSVGKLQECITGKISKLGHDGHGILFS